MNEVLQVLQVEDAETDAALVACLLESAGYEVRSQRVATAGELRAAIARHNCDLVIAAHQHSQLDALGALQVVQESGRDIPFIVVSDCSGEELAVEMMRAGAHDYLLKRDLTRLAPVVRREVRQARARRARKQTEDALLASEAKFRSYIENAPVAVFVAGVDGRFADCNLAAVDLLGYDLTTLCGMHVAEIHRQEDREKVVRDFAALLEAGHLEREYELQRRDGTLVWTWFRVVRLANGLSVAYVQDISGRKQTESELREWHARYQAFSETSTDGFWLLDRAGHILEISDAYVRRSGYTRDELLTMNISDLDVVETPDVIARRRQDVAARGALLFETQHRAKDGSLWHVEINACYVPLNDGAYFACIRDITRRKRSEAILHSRVRLGELARAGSAHALMQAAVDEAEQNTGSRIAFLHWLAPDQETLSEQVWSTNIRKVMCEASREQGHNPVSKAGIWAECVRRRTPVIFNDYSSHPNKKAPDDHAPLERVLVVPVLRGDSVAAVLGVGNKNTSYTQEDVDVVSELASLVTHAVVRKQAEEALTKSERTLSLALDASSMGIWELDTRTNALTWSPECYRLSGLKEFGGTLEAFTRVVHPDDSEYVLSSVRDTVATGTTLCTEFRIVLPSGEVRWVSNLGRVIRDADGTAGRIIGTVQDITDRKRAEDALRKSEERFRSLVETMFEWIWECDASAKYSYASPNVRALLGYEPEEVIGRTPFEFMPEGDSTGAGKLLSEMMRSQQPFTNLVRTVRHRDGSPRVIESSGVPVRGPSGEFAGYRGVGHDVTERKRAERHTATRAAVSRVLADAPSLSEAGLRVIEALCETDGWDFGALWQLGRHGSELVCTEIWQREGLDTGRLAEKTRQATSLRGSGLEGQVWESAGPVVLTARCGEAGCVRNRLALKAGLGCAVGLPLRFEGRIRGVLELRGREDREPDTGLLAVLCAIADQTGEFIERKRVQEELQRFVAASPSVIYALKLEGGEVSHSWTSDNCRQLTGDEPGERNDLAGWIERTHPEDRERVQAAHPIPYEIDHQIVEYRYRRKQGGYVWVRDEKRLTRDSDGKPSEIVGSLSDVTQRVELEEQLRQAQKMEAVGSLAGGIAHDFNNLLTVIIGYARLLPAELKPGDPLRGGLEQIQKAGERAAALTQQLLAFSRKQTMSPQLLSLNQVVADLQSMLTRMVGDDVQLEVRANAGQDTIRADRQQLEQVLMNLVVNARDAMPHGGRLTIETSAVEVDGETPGGDPAGNGWVRLTVTDTGTGMDEKTQQRIFEPFFTTKETGRGTGLGLSMAQGIVAQSGGRIDVSSRPGEGARFTILLPLVDGPAPAEASPAPVSSALAGKETILVVEDKQQVRAYTVAALKSFGYRVLDVESAAEALEICNRDGEQVDLVLTDVMMPNMSGRELARRLAGMQPRIQIVYMSGYADDVVKQDGEFERGAAFLQKPFSPDQLSRTLHAALGSRTRASILIVDDEAEVRGFLRTALERRGYEVREASDGDGGLAEIRSRPANLVLTDLLMPGREGIETIQDLRREMPSVRVIAISGKHEYLPMARLLGADAVMVKPIDPDLLAERIHELLSRPR